MSAARLWYESPVSDFWDKLKPSKPVPVAVGIDLDPDRRIVRIAWSDGAATRISARSLRQNCPCASCVDEWTHKRTLDPSSVPEGLAIAALQPVGNYAVQFQFGDGHDTGLYDWAYLRELAEKNPA